jgi:3-oxoacyl-[acyl-carrier-protein] synthase-1
MNIYLNQPFAISSLGISKQETADSLRTNSQKYFSRLSGYLPHEKEADLVFLPIHNGDSECRNNVLADYCIRENLKLTQDAISRYGSDRVAVIAGTSTSSITEVEKHLQPYYRPGHPLPYDPNILEISNISNHIKKELDLAGASYTIATACSSAARVLISGAGLLKADLCDAVISVSSDSLSKISIGGFNALGALSTEHCRPFHKDRNGINIGEGAGFTIMTRERISDDCIKLIGYGSSSDAYHISSPSPDGCGAEAAVRQALHRAGITPDQIGYINTHGTGTKLNDSMEGACMSRIFGSSVPCSSTKHLTGHTLGSCGLVECFICSLIMQEKIQLPYHQYTEDDFREEFPNLNLAVRPGMECEGKYTMSNNFAFGGNNASLIFGPADD